MQQVLFIGWWNVYPTREDFVEQLKTWDNNPFEPKKKWKNSLSKDLWENYQVAMIDMPNKNIASYTEWKIRFEKIFPFLEWDQIIIAHSLGTIFTLKYLAENWFPNGRYLALHVSYWITLVTFWITMVI